MAVVGNFIFLFFRLMWEFLDLESERGGSVNNKIIDILTHTLKHIFIII